MVNDYQLGGFRLHLRRGLTGNVSNVPVPSPEPVNTNTKAEASDLNQSAITQLLAISKLPSSRDIQTMLDNPADEGVVIIRSPKVRTPTINVTIVL